MLIQLRKDKNDVNTKMETYTKALVENNLDVVKWVIRRHIHTNENVCGLGFDDLFQEGCLYLLKAAETYDAERAGFETYAKTVVRNGLISHCRQISERNKKVTMLPLDTPANPRSEYGDTFTDLLEAQDAYTDIDTLVFLAELKRKYTGTVRSGIEALEWRVRGYTITEIAGMYGIKPNLVGARISRAAQVLRHNPFFLDYTGAPAVEKRAA